MKKQADYSLSCKQIIAYPDRSSLKIWKPGSCPHSKKLIFSKLWASFLIHQDTVWKWKHCVRRKKMSFTSPWKRNTFIIESPCTPNKLFAEFYSTHFPTSQIINPTSELEKITIAPVPNTLLWSSTSVLSSTSFTY